MTLEESYHSMSQEQLRTLLEQIKGDENLQKTIKEATDINSLVAVAEAAGFMITAEDLQKAVAEISEEELESVTGGTLTPAMFIGRVTGVAYRVRNIDNTLGEVQR